ncbi:MAG: hypothetical protein HQK57_03670 [Deltaproteobacteria bacterium]|nr:hypothetical protein [Deltaproteobacteria bacterium]
MSEPLICANNPEVNVDELMSRVRAEATRIKHPSWNPSGVEALQPTGEITSAPAVIDLSATRTVIATAESEAGLCVDPPRLVRFRGLTGFIARWVGKIVLFLSLFIINRQRAFNTAVVYALKSLTDHLDAISSAAVNRLHSQVNTALAEIEAVKSEYSQAVAQLKSEHEEMKKEIEAVKSEQARIIDQLKKGIVPS